jgi:hypothetical protein
MWKVAKEMKTGALSEKVESIKLMLLLRFFDLLIDFYSGSQEE